MNPQMCNACEQFAHYFPGGAEVEISMLFADVRGSTTLAEGLSPAAFSGLIDRFYQVATHTLIHSNALIEKLIGDEVVGLYTPGFAGLNHTQRAIEAAQQILRATGHEQAEGPWIPVGIGVHTGLAFIGSVGQANSMTDIAALGDSVNTAARIASQAKTGEVLVSEAARQNGQLATTNLESRDLQLKGRAEPVDVWVVSASKPM
jgi:adenylate cyclase